MDPDMARAFQDASGFNPAGLSNLLQLFTLAVFYLWGGWVMYGLWQQYASESIKADGLFKGVLRTILLLVLVSFFFFFQE